jgi:hypothetical protein
LREAIEAAVGLANSDVQFIQLLMGVGEWLVAFEALYTQIHEWGIGLRSEMIHDLEELDVALGVDPVLANDLWEMVDQSE